jgi:hypothetical protein
MYYVLLFITGTVSPEFYGEKGMSKTAPPFHGGCVDDELPRG